METPILFIIPGACSLGSMVALEWSNIEYQVSLTTPEIRSSEDFRKINPTGKVGALKDGDKVIGENLAILLYLADKFPANSMCPSVTSRDRVKVYQWLSYLSSTLHPAYGQLRYPERFIDEGGFEEFKKLAYDRLIGVLNYIEQSLLPGGYFINNDYPTIVDAQAYGLLRWSRVPKGATALIEELNLPMIQNFMQQMEHNPAVKNALAIEEERIKDIVNSKFSGYYKFK